MGADKRRQVVFVKAESSCLNVAQITFKAIAHAAEGNVLPRNFTGEEKSDFKAFFPCREFG